MSDFIRGKVSASGRVVLPAELRQALGIEEGEEVIFRRTEYGIVVSTLDQAVQEARDTVKRYVPEGVSLVKELRQDRREDRTFD